MRAVWIAAAAALLLIVAVPPAPAQTPLRQNNWPPAIDGESHVYKNVDGIELRLWIQRPADSTEPRPSDVAAAPRPAVVFFFGGGWSSGTPEQFLPQARHLAARGLITAVADYRVASRHGVKAAACVEDAKSAVRWLRQHADRLGIDPARICAAGGSAGGHIACCTALIPGMDSPAEDTAVSSVPNALALFNPAVMLAALDGVDSPRGNLDLEALAKRLGTEPAQLSPIHHVRANLPPTVIFHGEQDPTVPISTVAAFTERMQAAGNRCELMRFPGAPHGFFNLRPDSARAEQQRQWHLRTLHQLDQFFVSLGWLTGPSGLPVVDSDAVRLRGHLQQALRKFAEQREGRVVFLGGSITEMQGYRPLVEEWLKTAFPETRFTFVNAGIASTCSHTGAFRFQRDVVADGPVDLLFVEFAVNDDQDAQHDADGCVRGMEGIIRQLFAANPAAGAVMVHFVNPELLTAAQAGKPGLSVTQHERVARHYHVSSVDLPADLAAAIAAGTLSWEQWGGTHPGPAGNRHTANQVIRILEAAKQSAIPEDETPLPEPLLASSFDRGRFVDPATVTLMSGWQRAIPDWPSIPGSKRDRFLHGPLFFSETPGAVLSFPFTGRAVGAYLVAGPDAGQLEFRIDDGDWQSVELFHHHSRGLHYPRTVMFSSDLPAGAHKIEIRLSASHHPDSKGTAARILEFAVNE
jgi:acetyl esterase/lipase/lysophospholipase L1-like esterase